MIQCTVLNCDTWENEAVAQIIISNFIFWQVNDDTEDDIKVCSYYKLESSPTVLVVDLVIRQKMRSWKGMIQPETLLEMINEKTQVIQEYESGKAIPNQQIITKLEKALGAKL